VSQSHHPEDGLSARPNDENVHNDVVSPNPDVFSYFMLAAPCERKRHGRFTVDAGMSYVLVVVTLLIQAMLLYCVYDKVIGKNTSWQKGILNTGRDWNLIDASNRQGCNDGGSLCTFSDGIYSCAPPSVQLMGHWDELDLNKDGVWTQDEVHEARDSLKCKYAVDPLEVFGVLITLLKERSKLIYLHPNVVNGSAIDKAYFTYIMGDVAMCGYRNQDMCPNLLKRGYFDAPLTNVSVPRVGTTIADALRYCHDLLDEGGLCERLLPSTYSTWKIESVEECGEPKYKKFVYTDRSDGDIKSMLAVDYEARQDYEMSKTLIFKAYKWCIVFMWILLICSRLREVEKCAAWVWGLPPASAEDELDDQESELQWKKTAGSSSARSKSPRRLKKAISVVHSDHDHVRFISNNHRIALCLVIVWRTVMLLTLFDVGLYFLGRQTQYIDLLLDGVALMFIIEVAEVLYAMVFRQDVKSSWQEREPLKLTKFGLSRLGARPDVEDAVFLVVVMVLTTLFMVYYSYAIVEPIYDSLQCACLGEGKNCHEATRFSRTFWDNYWTNDVPASIKRISGLKDDSLPVAMVQGAGRRAANLLKHKQHMHLGSFVR